MSESKGKNLKKVMIVVLCLVLTAIVVGAVAFVFVYTPKEAIVYDYEYLGSEVISDSTNYKCKMKVGIQEKNESSYGEQHIAIKVKGKKVDSEETFESVVYEPHEHNFSFVLTEEQKNQLEQSIKNGDNPNFYIFNRKAIFDYSIRRMLKSIESAQ